MCGSAGGSGDMRKQQQQQQREIEQGMQQINAVFSGGSYGVNPATTYDPNGSYFDSAGKAFVFDPKSVDYLTWLSGNKGLQNQLNQQALLQGLGGRYGHGTNTPPSMDNVFQKAYMTDLAKKGGLFTGTASSEGFNDKFFQDRTNAFENYATPFLNQQFSQQGRKLDYSLANKGLLGGSASRFLGNQLQREYGVQQQNIANQAIGQSQDLQKQIEGQRQSLTSQLQVSTDPLATAGQAIGAAGQFTAPSPFPAIGQLFNNFANTYLSGQLGSTYGQVGQNNGYGTGQQYNSGLGAPSRATYGIVGN